MMKKLLSPLLPIALLLAGAVLPATAQTARIAHLSHSGSAATLEVDNFGEIMPFFRVDSVHKVSDTTAVQYGEWRYLSPSDAKAKEKTRTVTFDKKDRRYYPNHRSNVKLSGFDSTAGPSVPAPVLKKPQTKRRKSAFLLTAPVPPQHPGVALAVALILTLGGAGWLLGERKARPQPAV